MKEKSGLRLILFFLIPVCFFLYLHSIFGTVMLQQFLEHSYYLEDQWWLHLLSGTSVTVLGAVWWKRSKKRESGNTRRIPVTVKGIPIFTLSLIIFIVFLFAAMSFFVWKVKWQPIDDQLRVYESAQLLIAGDYSAWDKAGYMDKCPNQTGIVLLFALCIRLWGESAYLWIQQINVICFFLGGYFLYRITFRTLSKGKTAAISLLLYLCFLPFGAYVTFVYGTMWGFASALAGFYFFLKYLDSPNWRDLIPAAICVAFSCVCKSNHLIVLVAMLCLCAAQILITQKWKLLAGALILCAGVWSAFFFTNQTASSITGKEISGGTSSWGFIAMGMQEGGRAPGWFNDYHIANYLNHDCDTELAAAAAREDIAARAKEFLAQPAYLLEFYSKKISSQWNNPTFQGFWIQQMKSWEREDIPAWVEEFTEDGRTPNRILTAMLNIGQSFILLGVLFYLFAGKPKNLKELYLAVLFLGGFFFHLLWEAKSQYTVVYFVLLIPYCAKGFGDVFQKLGELLAGESQWKPGKGAVTGFLAAVLLLFLCATQEGLVIGKLLTYYNENTEYQEYLTDRLELDIEDF